MISIGMAMLAALHLAADDVSIGLVARDLLPRPREIVAAAGSYQFTAIRDRLRIAGPSAEATARLADHVNSFIVPEFSSLLAAAVVESEPGSRFLLGFSAQTPMPLPLPWEDEPGRPQGYQLQVGTDAILISSATEVGAFYGLQTLAQLLERMTVRGDRAIPGLTIRDWPALAMRGYSEDYGRNQLPTIEDHKRSIRFLARYKMNTYLWFIEPDHFAYAFDPSIGADYDRFTFEEIRELTEYAEQFHVEIIPTVELLGHMEMLLSHPKYRSLAELPGGGDLCAVCEDSFQLVSKLVAEIAPAFRSRYFHCGLDESFAIGKGRSAEAVRQRGLENVFADYYRRMNELVRSHGKTMMMYADIVLAHPAMIDLLPRDIVMMFWDYMPQERYSGLDKLQQAGFTMTALSGLWDWVALYPIYDAGFRNMETLARQSAELEVMGHFVSSWGDPVRGAGGTNLSELNNYGVAYCGQVSWNPVGLPVDEFARAFTLQYFASPANELSKALTALHHCQQGRFHYVRGFFQTEPLPLVRKMAEADDQEIAYWQGIRNAAASAIAALETAHVRKNFGDLKSIALAARMLEFTADLVLLCRGLGQEMASPNFDHQGYAGRFEALATRQRAMWNDYRLIYQATNRPMNIVHIQQVWDWMHQQLIDTTRQVQAGHLTSGPATAPP